MDILTPGNNTALGSGWLLVETFGSQSFRWVASDAEIYVAVLRKVKHYLQLYLEPAPAAQLRPFHLQIKDENETLENVVVKGRQMISVELPPAEPAVRKLVLHAENGDSTTGDPRELAFRVFKIAFFPAIIDILPPALDAHLGSGWHPLESFEGETFRWAADNAKVTILDPGDANELLLELEPGPGVLSKPFVLRAVDDSGVELAGIDVKTRQRVVIPLAPAITYPLALTLHAEGGGKRIGSDDRVMNYRAFQYTTDLRAY